MVQHFECLTNAITTSYGNVSMFYRAQRPNPSKMFEARATGERLLGQMLPQEILVNHQVMQVVDYKIDLSPTEDDDLSLIIRMQLRTDTGRKLEMFMSMSPHKD